MQNMIDEVIESRTDQRYFLGCHVIRFQARKKVQYVEYAEHAEYAEYATHLRTFRSCLGNVLLQNMLQGTCNATMDHKKVSKPINHLTGCDRLKTCPGRYTTNLNMLNMLNI